MDSAFLPENIEPGIVWGLVSEYPKYIPDRLERLEEIRVTSLPESLAARKKEGEAFLTISELTDLVEWKLKHGTFRPKLLHLVKSNEEEFVRSVTSEAFGWHSLETTTGSFQDVAKSLSHLIQLKGIGPATGSLILSCYNPNNVPFFSDELYRWLHWEETGKGWELKIKYTLKEYESLYEKVQKCLQRLKRAKDQKVTALDLEKAVYVLRKKSIGAGPTEIGTGSTAKILDKPQSLKRKVSARGEREEMQPRSTRKTTQSKKPKLPRCR